MRGNADAVASAYSLDDYRIATDLGGEAAYADLRDRAWARGIRLASDMVPNHMGIDSSWVIEHPEWFLSLDEPPYPVYSFTGPDLSTDERVAIVLEDHYWDDSDAAVVFKRVDRRSGATRFVYHGNDGTSFPWNDTAQLDFIDPAVREQVIRTIIDVARHFPIIRFDAAMVLAKKHIQRLWWPEPGTGGGIPSRAEHAISKREFDKRMPVEFWREVVDRVAAEVPGTLLLAEAFWLLEGYFVRTLGMHRVYNSAFMHMLRDEDGAGYRKVVKETIEFDPEILKRYVNFMSNPDEKTAIEQFGKGDKYFGVATVLATLPGLPMLGHGQVQGFGEKYGMEFRRAILDERPDPWLVARHEREIFPLLHRRAWFAESDDFLLYDLVTDDGSVDEEVLAYSNGSGPERSLVLYHTRFASTSGRIRDSAAYARKTASGAKRLGHRSLAEGLALPHDPAAFVIFREARTGLEYLRSCREIRERGLDVSLGAYGTQVYWEFREVIGRRCRAMGSAGAATGGGRGPVARRGAARDAARPGPRAVARDLRRRPRRLGRRRHGDRCAARRAGTAVRLVPRGGRGGDRRRRRRARDRGRGAGCGPSARSRDRPDSRPAAARRAKLGRSPDAAPDRGAGRGLGRRRRSRCATTRTRPPRTESDRLDRATLLAWLALSRTGALAPGADVGATSLAWYDDLRLAPALVAGLHGTGFDEGEAWAIAEQVRVLLALPRPSTIGRPVRTADARLLEAWLANDIVRVAIGVNHWEGVDYLDRDRFAATLRWAVRLDAIEAGEASDDGERLVARLTAAAETAGFQWTACAARSPAKGQRRSPAGSGRRPGAGRTDDRASLRRRAALPQQDPPEERRRRRAVGEHRFEVRPVDEPGRLAEPADEARLGDGSDAAWITGRAPPPGGAPRVRCPTSPSSPRNRSTAGSMTAAPGRTWRAPRPPPGSRRRP